jgi:hypothetical protein
MALTCANAGFQGLFVFRLRIVRIGLGCRVPKHGIDSSGGALGTVLDEVGVVAQREAGVGVVQRLPWQARARFRIVPEPVSTRPSALVVPYSY